MAGKTALVTGGTAGVGLSVVRALVRSGVFVHFIGTRAAVGEQIERSLNGAGEPVCRFVPLDLSRLSEVEAFAHRFAAEVPALDVLANVAGVVLPTREETPEGFEKTLAIGYLAPFVLCRALTPALARAPHARIVNVSGSPGLLSKRRLDLADFPTRRPYSGVGAAIDAVHAKTVMTQTLSERLAGEHIDVNAFHPGAVRSDLGRSAPFPISLLFTFGRPFLSQNSKTADFVATAESLTGTTGQLFVGMRPRPLSFEADYRERLWAATEAMVTGR